MEDTNFKPQSPENFGDSEHLKIVKDCILNAGEKIKKEQERVNNPWYTRFNNVLHVVHGNLELASFEEHVLSQEKYEKISDIIMEIAEEVRKNPIEISEDKQTELLEKLKGILIHL